MRPCASLSPEVALSFMVQEPRGIMEWHRDRSLFSSRFR